MLSHPLQSIFIHPHSPTCQQSLVVVQCIDSSSMYVPGSSHLHSMPHCVTLLLRYSASTSSCIARLHLSCHHIYTVASSMWNMMSLIPPSLSCGVLFTSTSVASSLTFTVCTSHHACCKSYSSANGGWSDYHLPDGSPNPDAHSHDHDSYPLPS